VALSVGLPRPGVTRHRSFPESGLSSHLPLRASKRSSSLPRVPCPTRGARVRSMVRGVYRMKSCGQSGPVRHGAWRKRVAVSKVAASSPAPTSRCVGDAARLCRSNLRQSNRGPGSLLRSGAMSECPMTPSGAISHRAMIPRNSSSSAHICGSENG